MWLAVYYLAVEVVPGRRMSSTHLGAACTTPLELTRAHFAGMAVLVIVVEHLHRVMHPRPSSLYLKRPSVQSRLHIKQSTAVAMPALAVSVDDSFHLAP